MDLRQLCRDGSAIADRVFDVLQRMRFDVFLDRFRIDPGADFLVRIQDEIVDKSMVVVIETPEAVLSDWVRQEVDVAAARRLGLAAVNLGGSETIREIAEPARCRIDDDDAIGRFLLEQHRVQLAVRRESLRESVYTALRYAGLPPSEVVEGPHGFVVDRGGRRRIVGVSVRPADLHRFRLAYKQARGDEAFLAIRNRRYTAGVATSAGSATSAASSTSTRAASTTQLPTSPRRDSRLSSPRTARRFRRHAGGVAAARDRRPPPRTGVALAASRGDRRRRPRRLRGSAASSSSQATPT